MHARALSRGNQIEGEKWTYRVRLRFLSLTLTLLGRFYVVVPRLDQMCFSASVVALHTTLDLVRC